MDESKLGGALEHWLGFQDKIGRAFMMNEDALKYPLSDYLVNSGGAHINTIELELTHPDFSNRLIDLTITDNNTIHRTSSDKIINAFELKLAKTSTRHLSEKKRLFNDLIRMAMANQHSKGKCYFIIAGKSADFETNFRNYEDSNKVKFYRQWFKFAKGQKATFNVASETNTDYKSIYDNFVDSYEKRYIGGGTLTLPKQISTTCEFVTAFKVQYVPYMAGVWSVE